MSETQLDQALRLIGLSHHTAPVALRERLAFRPDDLPRALGGLLSAGCREVAILSTCNRVEILAVARQGPTQLAEKIIGFLSEHHGVPSQQFSDVLYRCSGAEAAAHLFEVASSLDSQILGETEILAQTKEAYRVAAEEGACGPVLRALFERTFFLAKQVRTEGGIGRLQASVSSAAVLLARKLFEIKGRKLLVIGTGEMATGIVRALRGAGVGELFVASRTAERAAEFAAREGGRPYPIAQLGELLAEVDLVLVSAAAPSYVVRPAQIQAAAQRRHGRLLCLIDISVPRNVDPAVAGMEDTYLYDIDDLEQVAREGRVEREVIAAKWRPRLALEARELLAQLQQQRQTQSSIRKLLDHSDAIRQEVLKHAQHAGLDERALAEVARALERLQGRFLHGPLEALKHAARDGDGSEASAWISRLFRLESPVILDETGAQPQSGSQAQRAPKSSNEGAAKDSKPQ